tara:strand:+ start:240 stop:698 length:459 start_codon:yes stop_codon:yes gene_type:complete
MELIYHYTSEKHLSKILETGELTVSEWEKKNKVKPPALWLSLDPVWENTATKLISENGKLRSLTKEEQHQKFGLIRFVLEFKKENLCSWGKYKYKSNTPIQTYESMEQSGIEKGANPKEWYASFKNIPLSNCISCQKWNGKEWEAIINYTKA